jgi:predicted lipid carrier protein YhbT
VRRIQRGLGRWFARRIGRAKRERLERAMRGPRRRRMLLWVVFRAMPRAVRRKALERERAVIEWRITGRPDGRHDVRQLVIADRAATVVEGEQREADLTLVIEGVAFLLLVTGNASGPTLFVRGDVQVEGDPWLAMRLPRLFGTPT